MCNGEDQLLSEASTMPSSNRWVNPSFCYAVFVRGESSGSRVCGGSGGYDVVCHVVFDRAILVQRFCNIRKFGQYFVVRGREYGPRYDGAERGSFGCRSQYRHAGGGIPKVLLAEIHH